MVQQLGAAQAESKPLKRNKLGVLVPAPKHHSPRSGVPDAAPRLGSLQCLQDCTEEAWYPSLGDRQQDQGFGSLFELKIYRGVQAKEEARGLGSQEVTVSQCGAYGAYAAH